MDDINKIFKDALPEKFYNNLVKLDFINDAYDMFLSPSLINIDLSDLKTISNDELVGSISQIFTNLDDEYIIKLISNKKPNGCMINVSSGDLNLRDLEKLLDKLRDRYPGISIIFGVSIIPELNKNIKVQALLLNGKFEKAEEPIIKKEVVYKKVEENKKDDKDLLIDIAYFCVDMNSCSINSIQNKFGLGFNRTSILVSELESLNIISHKVGTNPRTILINDKEIIKNIINDNYGN